MIKWTKAKVRVTRIPFCACGRCRILQKQIEDRKAKWQHFECLLLVDNYWELVENQLNSSGIFSKDVPHCRFFRKSRLICKIKTLNLKKLNIELSFSMSMFNDIEWTKTKKPVTQFLREPVLLCRGILRRVNKKDSIHFSTQTSNTELFIPNHSLKQINSVSTEQSQTGVKPTCRCRVSRVSYVARFAIVLIGTTCCRSHAICKGGCLSQLRLLPSDTT